MKNKITTAEARQLWTAYQSGDIIALGKLMQHYYRDLLHWGTRFHHEQEFVKDCIQEVFLNLWKSHQTVGIVDNVKGYLFVVLKSRMLADLSNKNVMDQATILEDYSFSAEFGADRRLIDEEHEVYQFRNLERVLNTLPQRQKELIYLRFYQNLSFEQIAEVMNLGRQSTYNLFQKSLNNLRKNWPVAISSAAISTINYLIQSGN
jgi:RNA polymerase sigma factor (sigma-70 family)